MMKKTFIIYMLLIINIFAKEYDYSTIFSFLESRGIVVGKDIEHDELFELIQNGYYETNGVFDGIKFEHSVKRYLKIKKEYSTTYNAQINHYPTAKEVITILKNEKPIEIQQIKEEGFYTKMKNYFNSFLENKE